MFGYVRIDKPECKIREFEYYRGVYCGLCRALGKCGGQCARLTLTYDFTFLALVRMALAGETPSFDKRRCVAHPTFRHIEAKRNDSLDFCARASLMLSYRKLLDDIEDERGAKRLRARVLRPLFRSFDRHATKGTDSLSKIIEQRLSALTELEKNPPISLDRPASLFGELMGDMAAFGFEGERARIAFFVGMAVGKWVYIVDALDDFEKDAEKKRYNPLVLIYGEKPLDTEALSCVELALSACLAEAELALDLLDFPDGDMKALTENILHFGMPRQAKEILNKKEALHHE